MDLKDIQKFKALLGSEKQRIELRLKESLNNFKDQQKDSKGDEVDEAVALLNDALEMKFHQREGKLLKKINKSLLKIKDGTFGECDDCGEDIDPRRLEIRPVTNLCIRCKELREKKECEYSDNFD